MGCGIGGPLRGVVRATGANVTGLTINKAQVARAREITKTLSPWMQARCHFEVQDYLNVKVAVVAAVAVAVVAVALMFVYSSFNRSLSLRALLFLS